MPLEILGDFRPSIGASPADDLWTSIAISYAQRLAAEDFSRFRIRGLPQGVANQKTKDGATVYEQPVTMDSNDVPESLRDRLEVPKAGEFWVRNYECMDCLDQNSKKPGRWIPHQRLKMHMAQNPGHKIKKGRITMKGLKSTWTPDRQLFIGTPERLGTQVPLMPAAALTWAPRDPTALRRFSWIAILPARKGVDAEAAAEAVRKAVPAAESVVVLPKPPADKDALIAWLLREVDAELMAPGAGPDEAGVEDAELQEQIKRDDAANIALGRMRGAVAEGKAAKDVKEAVKT